MLAPDDRRALLEALRPPEGYTVDRAIATTFTLDLVALLTAPVAFSLFDGHAWGAPSGGKADPLGRIDPLALLQAVRAHAERLTVFCQAGQICNPGPHRRLLAYLEESVVSVEPPVPEGVFHPKVWVLRFVAKGEPVRYRVLCGSRNLTFDKSWDTLVSLDGELTDRVRAFSENNPLADFIAALPRMATAPFRDRDAVRKIADELRVTKFELPDGFEGVAFHPVGIENYEEPPITGRIERLLVVSPFVSAEALRELGNGGEDYVLVSRADQLNALPTDALDGFSEVHVLQDAAEQLDEDDLVAVPSQEHNPPPYGLHAKLYVADDGWDAHVWTGSLNATSAAFHQNVEFMVELVGKKSVVGVEAMLGLKKGTTGLAPLLARWSPPAAPLLPDPVAEALDQALRRARRTLAGVEWEAVIGAETTDRRFTVQLHRIDALELEESVSVRCWPILIQSEQGQSITAGPSGLAADFGLRAFDTLTRFFAFEVTASCGDAAQTATFVLPVRVTGFPADRSSRILESLLDQPEKVVRFLRMLLATDPLEILEVLDGPAAESAPTASMSAGTPVTPLLESLVRAASRDGARVEAVGKVLQELSATEAGRRALPPGLLELWDGVEKARKIVQERTS